jgi:integrase
MSVYKRGGVYWYDFVFRGQRFRESTRLTNKTVALRVEAIRKAELAEGRVGLVRHGPSPKFEGFVNGEFLPWCKTEHEAHPKTDRRYRTSAKPLTAFFGRLPLDMITTAQVEKFKLLRAAKISGAGTNRDLAALRFMLNFAVRQGHIVRNPVSGVRFLPEGPGSMRVVSHEEQRRYLAVASSSNLRDVVSLIVETGMRPEEVYTIRKENVHLNRRYLFIPTGKTRYARRNVPLTAATMEVLRRRLVSAGGAYLFGKKGNPDRPIGPICWEHRKTLRKAGIRPPFRLYDFRHTFGSRSAMAGVDLATLKELMGHSNISITMRYVHPTPEHKRAAVEKLERFNTEHLFQAYENRAGSPQNPPQ